MRMTSDLVGAVPPGRPASPSAGIGFRHRRPDDASGNRDVGSGGYRRGSHLRVGPPRLPRMSVLAVDVRGIRVAIPAMWGTATPHREDCGGNQRYRTGNGRAGSKVRAPTSVAIANTVVIERLIRMAAITDFIHITPQTYTRLCRLLPASATAAAPRSPTRSPS